MNAAELRIGNYLLFKDKIVKVEAIAKDTISVSGFEQNRFKPIYLDNVNLKPIGLTEDKLLKFGFEIEECFYYKKDIWLERICNETFRLEGFDLENNIRYVHRIQNIYSSLMEEELIINL